MNHKAKILARIAVLTLIISLMPVKVKAEGSYTVSTTSVTVEVGSTGSITVTANNAAGRVDISSEGTVTASDYFWLDNSSQTFTFKADSVGVGYIYVTPTDIVTYDAEELTNSYTIKVTVTEAATTTTAPAATTAAPETTAETETTSETETTTDSSWMITEGDILTDGDTDYEDLEKDERLYTYIDGEEYFIIQNPFWHDSVNGFTWTDEITGLELISGTEPETVNYKQVEVNCFLCYDSLYIYVLRNVENGEYVYCTLENGTGFSLLAYVVDNDKFYIASDFPDGFEIPNGYTETELTLCGTSVRALKQIINEPVIFDGNSETTEESTENGAENDSSEKSAGYTAEVYQDAGLEDVTDDIYYIFCMVNGETILCRYDANEETVQRTSLLIFSDIAETETAEGDSQSENGQNSADIRTIVFVIALAVAVVMLIILIITNIISRRRFTNYTKLHKQKMAASDAAGDEATDTEESDAEDEFESLAGFTPDGDAGAEDADADAETGSAEEFETGSESEADKFDISDDLADTTDFEPDGGSETDSAGTEDETEAAEKIQEDAVPEDEIPAESENIQVNFTGEEISGLPGEDETLK